MNADIAAKVQAYYASHDSLQVAQDVIRFRDELARFGKGEERRLLAEGGVVELRRRIAMLNDKGIDVHPYEDMAVEALREAGIEL